VSDLKLRLQMEIETRKLKVTEAERRLRKEEKEAQKERRKVPRELEDQLRDDIREARKAVEAAQISLEAVCKYPPLGRTG
jgi:hypothetical protein